MITDSRKGNIVINGLFIIIAIFVFTLVSMFGYKLLNDLQPDIVADVSEHNESVDAYNEIGDRYAPTFNGLIVFALMGFWSFMLVAAFMSNEHPILFIFMMLLLIFVIIASMILGNTYEEFMSDAEYAGVTAQFTLANFIMTNMLKINIAICMSALFVAFAKNRLSG